MKKQNIIAKVAVGAVLMLGWNCGGGSISETSESGHSHHSEEHSHDNDIELSERQIQTVGIKLEGFTRMMIGDGVSGTGELAVGPGDIADVTPIMSGVIKSINVSEGQRVSAGTPVARIENLEIGSLTGDYNEARLRLQQAQSELERQQKLASVGAGIAKNLEIAKTQVELARSQMETAAARLRVAGVSSGSSASASVVSPISGVVTKIYARSGAPAEMSSPIMTVCNTNRIYALIKIYEKDLSKVKRGQTVDLSLTNSNMTMQGVVEEVIPAIDDSKTIGVRVVIKDNRPSDLIPGMAVTAYINSGDAETLALPEAAVVQMEGKDYIFMLDGTKEEGGEVMYHFKPVEVVKGNSRNGYIEVHPLKELPSDARFVVRKTIYIYSMQSDHGEHNH